MATATFILAVLIFPVILCIKSVLANGREDVRATNVSCSSESLNLSWVARCTWTPGHGAKTSNVTYRVSFLDESRRVLQACTCEEDDSSMAGGRGCWDRCHMRNYGGSSSQIEFVSVAPWRNAASGKERGHGPVYPFRLYDHIVPSSPTGLRVANTSNMMYKVSWNRKPQPFVTYKYQVSYQEAPDGVWEMTDRTDLDYLVFTKKQLGSGGDYNVRVRAGIQNSTQYSGNWGPWSPAVQFTSDLPERDQRADGSTVALVIPMFACLIVVGVLSVTVLIHRKRLKERLWPSIPNFEPYIKKFLESEDLRHEHLPNKKAQGGLVVDEPASKVEVVSEVESHAAEKPPGLPVPTPHRLSHLRGLQVQYSSIARPTRTLPLFTIDQRCVEKDDAGSPSGNALPGGWLDRAATAALLNGNSLLGPAAPDGKTNRASLLRYEPERGLSSMILHKSNSAGGDGNVACFDCADDRCPFLIGERGASRPLLTASGVASPRGYLLDNIGRLDAYDRLLDEEGSRGDYSVEVSDSASGANGSGDEYVKGDPLTLRGGNFQPILKFGADNFASVSAAASSETAAKVQNNATNGVLKYVTLIHNSKPLSGDKQLDRHSGWIEFEERLSVSDYCREDLLLAADGKKCGDELRQSVTDYTGTAVSTARELQRLEPPEKAFSSEQVKPCAFNIGVEMHNGYVSEAAACRGGLGGVRTSDPPQYVHPMTAPQFADKTHQTVHGHNADRFEEFSSDHPTLVGETPEPPAASRQFAAGASLPISGYVCETFASSLTRLPGRVATSPPPQPPAAPAVPPHADTAAMQNHASVLAMEYPGRLSAQCFAFNRGGQTMCDWGTASPREAPCSAVANSTVAPAAYAGVVPMCGYVVLPSVM